MGDLETVGITKSVSNVHGQDLSWSHVNFTVKSTNVLTDCWGYVPAGKVCAIMGPSGAGKSSLLNVLAGRSAPAKGIDINGSIKVAGQPINPVKFRENIAYVMQDDALMATSTPREALRFSAMLRLPPTTTSEEVDTLVEKLLEELGLLDCSNTIIGGALIKGISGGQRKRTSVGIELITNPSLLFLDEPTSGLDSFSAFNLVKLLKVVANNNSVVLCTIHQPSSEVFYLFDIVIFMKEGRIFYQGPVDNIVSYFSQRGFQCPSNYNPSDFIMFVCQTEKSSDLESKGLFMTNSRQEIHEGVVRNRESTIEEAEELPSNIKAGIGRQIQQLAYRELIGVTRDIPALFGRFGVTILLNLLFGLIFLGAGNRDDSDSDNFNSHFGAIIMVAIASLFGTAQPVMLSFPFERPMFMREYSTGSYGAPAYFLSKLTMEFPLALAQVIVQYILVYFMIGFQGSWIFEVLSAWGIGLSASSTAVVLGCAVAEAKQVTELAPVLFVPQLLFAGFFIRTSKIPVFLRWAQWLCGLKYGLNLILLTEFAPENSSCKGGAANNCSGVISDNGATAGDWWIYFLLLIVLIVGFRSLGAVILVQKAKRFY
jgi:ABC-type multidrug transport system ATPase subunit